MQFFHSLDTIDWTRVIVVVSAATAFWTAMESITPPAWHKIGDVVLNALSVGIAVLVRGNKYQTRKEDL